MRERFHTTLNSELLRKFRLIAMDKRINVNDLLEQAMDDYIKGVEKNECTSKSS